MPPEMRLFCFARLIKRRAAVVLSGIRRSTSISSAVDLVAASGTTAPTSSAIAINKF